MNKSDDQRTFLFWPGLTILRQTGQYALFFVVFFYGIYGASAWLGDLLPWRFAVGFQWETAIPFYPHLAIVYTSIIWLMLLGLFVISNPQDIRLLVKVMCLQTLMGAALFLLLPATNNFPPRYSGQDLPQIFLIADLLNLRNNQLPSLHVCFAFTMALTLSQYGREPLQRFLLISWASAIAASALLMHEHNIMDLVGGILLALWGVRYWTQLKVARINVATKVRFPAE